ncbi:MAG TPA: hypothetical protein VF677_12010 [Flavobacterium sp.]|jgi:hypothetical protein
MKYLIFFIFSISLLSCNKNFNIKPSSYLTSKQQEEFKYSIIRYIEGLPANATNKNKFDTIFDKEYKIKAKKSDLLYYYKDEPANTVYFAIAKIAPSIKLKKNATVGKVKYNEKGEIVEYEEEFRTWKMEEEELIKKTNMLFNKYIRNEDLTPYYSKNSNPEFFIEFPDDYTFYDNESRLWKTKNSVQ